MAPYDDCNVITDDLTDLVKVDTTINEFESMSGAILSRSKKCKVFGFGSWRGKTDWPLTYIQTVQEIKIFGVFINDSYRSLLKRNWDFRFQKFAACINSWSSRFFPSLMSKVEVVKTFGLSRIYYIASILPMNSSMVLKIESLIGKFIWKGGGWPLRVALAEVKNRLHNGGLNLVCVASMCNSLLTSQFLRLLKSSDSKAKMHVNSWIGDSLSDLVPWFGQCDLAKNIPDYYCHIESLIIVGKIDDLVTTDKWQRITNKVLYSEQCKNFLLPKVQLDAGNSMDYNMAWKRISLPVLSSGVRDISYMLLHNKLPTKERLHRVGLGSDPFCPECPGSPLCNVEHYFCLCLRVQNVWPKVRNILTDLIGEDIPNFKLLNYNMRWSSWENEAVWLLGNYVSRAWSIMSSGILRVSKI